MRESGQGRGPRVFTRAATGLVREAGLFDALIYNVNFISIGLMVALMFLYIPSYGGSTCLFPLCSVRCSRSRRRPPMGCLLPSCRGAVGTMSM